jgi:hypothetical protein
MSDESSYYISILVGMRFDLQKKPMTPEYQTQITEYEKKLSEFSLPELEAEYQRAELVKLRFGKPEHALSKSEQERLSKLSPSELALYESASEDETVKNLVEAHRFRALTPELRAAYFGEPPDYASWGVLDCWTIDEATSLTLELNPKIDLFSKMKESRKVFARTTSSSRATKARHAVKVSRKKIWKEISVWGFPADPLLFEICDESEAALEHWAFADAAAEYIQLQDRIARGIDAGKLGEKIIPVEYMLWAANSGITVPNELKQAIEARNEITDWKARNDDLLKQHDAIAVERDGLKRELGKMLSKAYPDKIHPNERRSVKRLIIGMAVDAYGYNPKDKRSDATPEIHKGLARFKIKLDEGTIHKWLRASEDELSPGWEEEYRKPVKGGER